MKLQQFSSKIIFMATLLLLISLLFGCEEDPEEIKRKRAIKHFNKGVELAEEEDFEEWKDRLQIYGLDLRHTPSVEIFTRFVEQNYDHLDILINNAATNPYFGPMIGIENVNEFYTTHYLEAIIGGDIGPHLERWKQQAKEGEAKAPWRRLSQLQQSFFRNAERLESLRAGDARVQVQLLSEAATVLQFLGNHGDKLKPL